jgi:hypothetical protein
MMRPVRGNPLPPLFLPKLGALQLLEIVQRAFKQSYISARNFVLLAIVKYHYMGH